MKKIQPNTIIYCNTKHVDCKRIKRLLAKADLSPVGQIFIMDVKDLIKQFPGDEEVEYDFTEEKYLAKMRNRYEENPQILVAADSIAKYPVDVDNEIGISIFHELAHHRGIQNEKKAESWARQRWSELLCKYD